MNTIGEYNGLNYLVPAADDGLWRWFVQSSKRRHSKRQLQKIAALNALPRPEYLSHALAVEAAKFAINTLA
jgi:hypothetical protein